MRLESPEMKVTIEQVEAAAFMEETAERFAGQLAGKQIELHARRGVDHFQADHTLLQRAVTNLLTNAIRHTPRGGKIELSIEAGGEGRTVIAVANSGEPIAAEDLEKVFDRLYRGGYARSSPGSGLGLTIARRIAELHGGTATIRNREQAGVVAELIL